MSENIKTYRIRTEVGNTHDAVIHIPLNQTYDMLEILSLKLDQKNTYKYYTSDYGVVVGRVQANDAVGIPNCKVSIFIPYDEDNTDVKKSILYHYSSVQSTNGDGVRYNLLPDELDEACHQNVGTFPNKRLILDNKDELEIFEEYWKYTTVTNESGDYMLYGIPTGSQQLHVDIDLSDIGIWSQKPTDMVYKGYTINQFDSPTKFKQSKNLNSLSQIYTQDRGLYVYPYWGETTENGDTIGITRCDINIDYKFEPTCIFMGSIITDSGNNAIGKNCAGDKRLGKMANLTTGEGSIEMIRKTFDNKVEQIRIKGDRVINGDGVWCYQIPMNLDYVKTDEYGNLVPSDDPSKGIPTRARVRFRISLDDQPNDGQARKRCKYLVPNNPHMEDEGFAEEKEPDYEFGSSTREESFCDLFWNKVYSVKNYIPRFQKKNKTTIRDHSGIKLINHYGDGINPMPYNNLTIKLNFTYRLICVIVKIFIYLIEFINKFILWPIVEPFCVVCKALKKINKIPIVGAIVKPLRKFVCAIPDAVKCISISENFCDDGVNPNKYYPGCNGCMWSYDKESCQKEQSTKSKEDKLICTNNVSQLFNCIENDLAQDNEATSFNFENDWVNGVLYAPLWYRKIQKKKKFFFGLFTRKAKDEWCSTDSSFSSIRLFKPCATTRNGDGTYKNFEGDSITYYRVKGNTCGNKCHESIAQVSMGKGVIKQTTNLLGKYVYYYASAEYIIDKDIAKEDSKGHINRLFATDIILLGSLNECDTDGIPQFFKSLDPTTYNLPSDILFTDHEFLDNFDEEGNFIDTTYNEFSEAAGCDWGNKNEYGKSDGGLFYNIGCSTINLQTKSCVNLSRICELGVSLDESRYVPDLSKLSGDENAYDYLRTDGFVSYDELSNFDARSQFATLNSNKLSTKVDTSTGLKKYDFRFLYPENFDGSLLEIMKDTTKNYSSDVNYRLNYNLENKSVDYYKFRMGDKPYYYDNNHSFPRYENSFYFYFGLKDGKTAIEKFNSDFFADCETLGAEETAIGIKTVPNSWCGEAEEKYEGYVALDLNNISSPYSLDIDSNTDNSYPTISYDDLTDGKIIIGGNGIDKTSEAYKKLIEEGYVAKILENNKSGIPNGEYTVTITDSNGDITTTYFSLKSSSVKFSTSIDNFNKDNNTLAKEYKTNYGNIANDKNDVKFEDNEATRKIGGVIGIYNIINGNDYLTNSFKVTISPNDKNSVLNNTYNKLAFVINSAGKIDSSKISGDGLLLHSSNNESGFNFVIGVPYGGMSYIITITQLCGNNDSNNSTTATVTVDEPIKYKLFVEDVDISVIEKGFSTGWTISGKSTNPSIKQDGTFSGWLNISDESNLNDYNKGQTLFDWEQNARYKKETYGYTTEEAETSEVNQNAIAEAREARQNFITAMKSAFYLTCSDESKDLHFSVQTNSSPYDIAVVYRPEETMQGVDTTYNVVTTEGVIHSITSSIESIEIPTITYVDNLTYGGGTKIKGNASYTVDSRSEAKDKYKQPYFIACVDNDGNTIPSDNVGKSNESGTYTLSGDVKGYFGFHLIDKRFSADYIAWSYINSVPYYKPSNNDNIGKYIKMSGIFAGYIYNGIPSNTPSADNYIIEFETQVLGNNALTVKSIDHNEDSIPTRRIMYYEPSQTKANKYVYEGYKVSADIDNNHQYVPVSNSTLTLDVEDTDCYISNNIDGNLKITLSSTAINDLKNKQKLLNVSNNLSMEESEISYYAFNVKDTKYPLNSITYDDEKGYVAKLNNNMNAWEETNPLTMFNYTTTVDVLMQKIDKKVSSYSTSTDEEGETVTTTYEGYGNSGNFTIDSKVENDAYYIIGITSDNTRVISPVYNFAKLKGTISFGTYTSKVEDGTEKDETGKEVTKYKEVEEYKVSFSINNISDDTYYFKYFAYTLDVLLQFNETNKIEASGTVESGTDGVLFADLTEKDFSYLSSYSIWSKASISILNKKTTFTAIDCTGLKHLFGINTFKQEDKYIVIWKLNNDNAIWHDDDVEDVEKTYLTDKTYNLNDSFHNGNAPTSSDGYELIGWSTDKNTTWEDEYSTTDEGYHKVTDTISSKTAQIWYGIWHKKISVTYSVVNSNGTWKDGTTEDIILHCDENNQCKLTDATKMNPLNSDSSLMFSKWACNDDTVVISEDGTVTTVHNCVVYPNWISAKVVAETNHTLIDGNGDSDSDYTKLYYYIKGNDANYADNVTFEEVALSDGELKLQFSEISTTVEDGKNVKTIKVAVNDVNEDRYYRFRAKNNLNGTYSDIVEIRQVGKEQIILPSIDYFTFSYIWTANDGSDLDSATTIRNSHIPIDTTTTLDDYYVGFGGNGNNIEAVTKYIQYGGDNRTSGAEGALINWKDICAHRDYISEGVTTLYCDIYANWYQSKGNGQMKISYGAYKGDTGMELEDYRFKPKEGTVAVGVGAIGNTVYACGYENAGLNINEMKMAYSHVATLEYDIKSNNAIIHIIEEQTGVDNGNDPDTPIA